MVNDPTVNDIVAAHVSYSARERYRERFQLAVRERTLDVACVIVQPFTYRDVWECVDKVLRRDGWEWPAGWVSSYDDVRRVLLDLEQADQLARIRATAGRRAHLFVRTDRGPSGTWPR